jgi:hypothetical protein
MEGLISIHQQLYWIYLTIAPVLLKDIQFFFGNRVFLKKTPSLDVAA